MKFIFNASPNLRQKQSTNRIMLELTIGLLVVFAFSLAYYNSEWGLDYVKQALILMAVSIVVALLTEIIWSFFVKKDRTFNLAYIREYISGSFGVITAIILTLMCPISLRPYALGVATFFAIFFGKLVFGGFGNNIFNPAALGRAVIFATFVGATTDVLTGPTPTGVIATEFNWLVSDTSIINQMMHEVGGLTDLFLGWYPGAIGETSALVIILVGIVLAIRKVIDWRAPVVYLGAIFVLTAGIALMRGVGSYEGIPGFIWYPLVHVLAGGAVFGAVFMLTDPVTSPTSAQGRCIFALGAAIITVLIRVKANLPEGCLYSILLMNMFTPMIDKALEGKQLAIRKKAIIIFTTVFLVGGASVLLAGNVIEAKEPKPTIFLTTSDEAVNKFDAKVIKQVKNKDGSITFSVQAQGYKSFTDPKAYNTFEIVVKDKIVVSLTPTDIVDTEYIGTKIESEEYLKQFQNQDLTKDIKVEVLNDVVSGATFSSQSSVRALQEVRKTLGY